MPKPITYIDLQEDLKINNDFLEAYPDLTKQIEKYRKSPNCGSCRGIINIIMKGDIEPLKKVYGDDVSVDINSIPKPRIRIPKPALKKMTLEEYEEFVSNTMPSAPNVLPNAFYVEKLDQVWVHIIEYEEKE